MALLSMTGYGKSSKCLDDVKITIEIKSVNSKQLDIKIKMPPYFAFYENQIRKTFQEKLVRGFVDVYISHESIGVNENFKINKELFAQHYQQMKETCSFLKIKEPEDVFSTIIRMPDVMKTERSELSEKEWVLVNETLMDAIEMLNETRAIEGKNLEKDIWARMDLILEHLRAIESNDDIRKENIRNRLENAISEINGKIQYDSARFEQEFIYYLEKLDITEEKVRLESHCNFFLDTLENEICQGKKLGFIIQEMGREINTIGSKANDIEIQKKVVSMKDELEKIKEQSMNIL